MNNICDRALLGVGGAHGNCRQQVSTRGFLITSQFRAEALRYVTLLVVHIYMQSAVGGGHACAYIYAIRSQRVNSLILKLRMCGVPRVPELISG